MACLGLERRGAVVAQVDEVVGGIYRISTFMPAKQLQFNQFLIDDELPALIHTGTYPMYEDVREAVAEVLDPKRLAYVICPHFEADECGGMGRFVAEAPEAVLACSELGFRINLTQWDYSGPVRGFRDGDTIDLGEHRLRFLETPHVHHWDSMMVFEETTSSLFPADLYVQSGDQPAIVRENLGKEMCHLYREWGIFAAEGPVRGVVDRIEKLEAQWINPMHGGGLPKEAVPGYTDALRSEPFAFRGKLFGRGILD
jgi:flavorubredoxin